MRNREKTKRRPDKRVIGIIVLLLLVAATLFITDAFGLRGGDNGGEGEGGNATAGLPEMSAETKELGGYLFYSAPEEHILESLIPVTTYTRLIRRVETYDDRYEEDYFTLTVDGDCWQFTNGKVNAFSDGERVYLSTPAYAEITDSCDFYTEIGITPLSRLIEDTNNDAYEKLVSANDRTVRVQVVDPVTGIIDQYEVSIENGIVLTETSAYNGEVYRNISTRGITTDNVSLDVESLVNEFMQQYGDTLNS